MKNVMKTLAAACLLFGMALLWSCTKPNTSFDGYFYLSQPVNENSTTLNIDGTNYGAIQYIAPQPTAQSSGINHVKLPDGRHNITVYDGTNTAIITSYIDISSNSAGTGSWGSAGGSSSCSSTNSTTYLVGLSQ